MGRTRGVKYYESRGAYFTNIGGTQHRLATGPKDEPAGPTYTEALAKFRELHELLSAEQAGDRNPVRVLVEKYLRDLSTRAKPQTITKETHILKLFAERFGDAECREMKPAAVYEWLSDMGEPRAVAGRKRPVSWGPQSRRLAVAVVSAMFNWCVEARLIPINPLGRLRRPAARSRGKDALLGATPAERRDNHARILAAAPSSLRPLIILMEATGCRPGELCSATAADFDARAGAFRFRSSAHARPGDTSHKAAGLGKERLIILQGEAAEIVAALMVEHPEGPIFRRRGYSQDGVKKHGGAWTSSAVADAFERIRERTGIPCLTAYSYRHTFATAWLEQGKPIDILATVLGNSEPIIRKHYAHLLVDVPNLRSHLSGFSASGAAAHDDTPSPLHVFCDESRETA